MKKNILTLIPLIILLISCAGSAKPTESSGGMTLDQALHEAAKRIDERIAAGSKIAPLNFNSPHDKFSGYVLDELTANLVESRRLTIVDRKEVDLIRGEFDFQFSGEVGDDSMQELGRMLGAQAIISGSVTDMGDFYRIVIRVLNVQNASVEVQYRANIENDRIVKALMVGGRLERTASTPRRAATAQTSVTPATAPVPSATPTPALASAPTPPPKVTYEIGSRGPAGGFVFYDKGNNSGGWQYLEAIPVDFEFRSAWGETATTDVASLFVRGYGGWRLPTRIELNQMYINLKQKRLGDFKGGWYWSSSENGTSHAWTQDFSDGEQRGDRWKGESYLIRAVRQF